jgi:hypothetical protein
MSFFFSHSLSHFSSFAYMFRLLFVVPPEYVLLFAHTKPQRRSSRENEISYLYRREFYFVSFLPFNAAEAAATEQNTEFVAAVAKARKDIECVSL